MTRTSLVSPRITALAGYVPGEQPRDRSYVKLNTNENPYPPSERVLAAVQQAVNGDLRLYPDPVALTLRETASARYGVSPDFIMAGNGSDELLSVVMRASIDAGDSVAYATPTYSLYDTLVALQGGKAIRVPYPVDFALPVDALLRAGARVTIVCNPNAPSGTLTPWGDIERLARSASGLLVVDEAYVDFASGTAIGLVARYPNLLVLRTFSKSFSLCALRVGLGFAQPALIHELSKVRDSYSVNHLGLVAANAALQDYAYMQASTDRIREERSALSAALAQRGFDVLPSQTNFLLARRPGGDLSDYQQRLKQEGVLVRYFGTPELRDALRITVGTPEQSATLLRAIDAIGHPT